MWYNQSAFTFVYVGEAVLHKYSSHVIVLLFVLGQKLIKKYNKKNLAILFFPFPSFIFFFKLNVWNVFFNVLSFGRRLALRENPENSHIAPLRKVLPAIWNSTMLPSTQTYWGEMAVSYTVSVERKQSPTKRDCKNSRMLGPIPAWTASQEQLPLVCELYVSKRQPSAHHGILDWVWVNSQLWLHQHVALIRGSGVKV